MSIFTASTDIMGQDEASRSLTARRCGTKERQITKKITSDRENPISAAPGLSASSLQNASCSSRSISSHSEASPAVLPTRCEKNDGTAHRRAAPRFWCLPSGSGSFLLSPKDGRPEGFLLAPPLGQFSREQMFTGLDAVLAPRPGKIDNKRMCASDGLAIAGTPLVCGTASHPHTDLCRQCDHATQHPDRQHPALRNRQQLLIFIPPRIHSSTRVLTTPSLVPLKPHQPNPKTHIPVALIKTAVGKYTNSLKTVRKKHAKNTYLDHETNERRIAVRLTAPVKQTNLTEIYAQRRLASPQGYCASPVSLICGKAAPPGAAV